MTCPHPQANWKRQHQQHLHEEQDERGAETEWTLQHELEEAIEYGMVITASRHDAPVSVTDSAVDARAR